MTPTTTADRTTATAVIDESAVIDKPRSRVVANATTAIIVAGAVLVAATAGVHLHLWLSGYRHVPRLGVLFIAQAVSGLAIASVLALTRHTVAVVIAAAYMAASAGGLLLSATVGFVGVHDGLGVPWAAWSLAIELVGLFLLGGAGLVRTWRR